MWATAKAWAAVALAGLITFAGLWLRRDAKQDAKRNQEIEDAKSYKRTTEAVSRSQEDSAGLDDDAVRKRLRDLAGRD